MQRVLRKHDLRRRHSSVIAVAAATACQRMIVYLRCMFFSGDSKHAKGCLQTTLETLVNDQCALLRFCMRHQNVRIHPTQQMYKTCTRRSLPSSRLQETMPARRWKRFRVTSSPGTTMISSPVRTTTYTSLQHRNITTAAAEPVPSKPFRCLGCGFGPRRSHTN